MYTDEEKPACSGVVSDTGALFGPVVVAVVALCGLAAAWLAAQAAVRINFDDEVTVRLLAAQARAIEVLSLHLERERAAGHELPFSEEERALLMRLEDDQRQLATLQGRPLPSPFEGATELVRSTTTALIPLALILGAFFVFGNNSQRRS
ncbi:hypothetical protein [Polyangium aurulentum]|uniref:hypothetical protein n=1 Tax=Polyangium aurulentum TaxID=2567896 RepID=UPI0010ADE22A|nr:hypothetical protein [Polyangium aurulentum]UQA60405.1 hypothetical protein E8A73_008000 [Polyangium aurulentum]